jgi:hypothetical protein
MTELTRRRLLMNTLFGAGLVGLRSLASGIPVSVLRDPRSWLRDTATAEAEAPPNPAQFIIFATSADGDPIACNAPGMYLDPGISHPQMPSMAPTALSLRGQKWTAALPWSQLPQDLLDRTSFFHHGTYSVVHSEEQKVLELGGKMKNNEMLISLLAAELGPALGTVQTEPLVLGPRQASEGIVFQTRPQPIVNPSALALLLGPPTGPLGQLTALRDRDLDRLNALVKSEGTPAQAAFIDRNVLSQEQLRSVSESLLSVLQSIPDDGVSSQILAAVTLIRMNVAPVISIHIPFGGDNHSDGGLMLESSQTVTGVASIGEIWSRLKETGLQDRVSFLSLNVFGRTLGGNSTNGRAHNANHHVAVMFGPRFRGSVIGGVEPKEGDYGATSIDAATGQGVSGGKGSIPFTDTLQSMALTFGTGVGVDAGMLAKNIDGGKPVPAALT